jgi:hypothetical protein
LEVKELDEVREVEDKTNLNRRDILVAYNDPKRVAVSLARDDRTRSGGARANG